MISIECPKCLRKLRVSDDAAGKTAKCPCGEAFQIPLAQTAKPKSIAPVSADTLQYFLPRCECGRSLRVAKGEKPKLAKCPCGSTFSVAPSESIAVQPLVIGTSRPVNAQAIPMAKPVVPCTIPLPSYHAPSVSYRGEINASVGSSSMRSSNALGERPILLSSRQVCFGRRDDGCQGHDGE
jgi:hypothetical protein